MIRFDSVSKQYRGGSRPALNSIDLEILRGEFVFLVGASGSGKSSCLRLILKEEKPSSGKIHVLGQDLGRISSRKVPYFRRNIGVVFQDFRLLPNKTVFDNVAFSLQVIGKSKGFIQEAVPDTLKMVGLAGKATRFPHELSGGEQQRVAIARAVVNQPAVLLADEPTGNLDPTTSAGIMALLERISAAGTTVVMATHEAGIVDQMQRRVIELSSGAIIRDEKEGGYGQTQAVPVIVDGMVIVAADDAPVPPIIEQSAAPVQVVAPDLRASAAPVSAAPTSGVSASVAPTPAVSTPAAPVVRTPAVPPAVAPASEAPSAAAPPSSAAPVNTAPVPPAFPPASAVPPATTQFSSTTQLPAAQPALRRPPIAPVSASRPAAEAVPRPDAAAQPIVGDVASPVGTDRHIQAQSRRENQEAVRRSSHEPAPASEVPPSAAPAQPVPNQHIQSQTGPIFVPTGDIDLPDQLSLAERLGLRAADEGTDQTGEQNVGPTK